MIVEAGQYGVDFLAAYPDPQLLKDRGCRFVACYLKQWDAVKVDAYRELGIGVVPIGEVSTDRAAGGATVGATDAARWVTVAREQGIPADNTVPIVMTNDTSNWSANHLAYFVAAEKIVRRGGYLFGGYGSKQMVVDCETHGVVFDVIWATNAYAWGGGRADNAHVWQGGHKSIGPGNPLWLGYPFDVTGFGSVDTNASRRPFPAWGPNPKPIPQPVITGVNEMPIVTNSEVFHGYQPGIVKFVINDFGRARHINEVEWHARGSLQGYALTNVQLAGMGAVL